MLRQALTDSLKTAMITKDQARTDTIRLILAKIKDADIAARPSGVTQADEAQLLTLLQGMIKQRKESITMYNQGNRPELAAKEQAEIDVITGFLPKQMSADEVKAAIETAVSTTGATSVKDMGKVMAELKSKYSGQMDFSQASAAVKERFAG